MKNNLLKPGIVIQGPLISKGRVPRSESIKIPDLKESDVVEFNCVDQIIKICETYSKHFPIIISTWKTEDVKLINFNSFIRRHHPRVTSCRNNCNW